MKLKNGVKTHMQVWEEEGVYMGNIHPYVYQKRLSASSLDEAEQEVKDLYDALAREIEEYVKIDHLAMAQDIVKKEYRGRVSFDDVHTIVKRLFGRKPARDDSHANRVIDYLEGVIGGA